MRRFLISFVVATILAPIGYLQAELVMKHFRVTELEDQIAKNTSSYLRSRFPERPFLVTVSIDPLRRTENASASKNEKERLPFFDFGSDEILDEWDDPQVSLTELMTRVKKIQVTVSLPNSVLDSEIVEIKDSLYSVLHLLNARDEILIERRPWKGPTPWWAYGALALGIAIVFLFGTYLINRAAVKRLAVALIESRPQMTSGGGAHGAHADSMKQHIELEQKGLQFNDPIKIRELMTKYVASIITHPAFPTHLDFFLLDQYGKRNPAGLGALLSQFPAETQKKIFSLSFHHCWLEAFRQPGTPTLEGLDILHRIIRHPHETETHDWDQLVLHVWRLDESLVGFLKHVTQDEAFALLSYMPKSDALRAAKKAFPGAWGTILNPNFTPKIPGKDRIRVLDDRALAEKPLNDFAVVERYKHEIEVLEYLRTAEITEEREIYEASPDDSIIHYIRPPFFKVLDQAEAVIKDFVPRFTPEQWAMALFNVARTDRAKIEKHLGEKQLFIFKEKLRRLDNSGPDKLSIAGTREKIGLALKEFLTTKQAAGNTEPEKAA